jgi:hypothetical protein
MKNNEKNKNDDVIFFNKIILGNRKIKKETKGQKRERIRMRMLTILDSIEKNLRKK